MDSLVVCVCICVCYLIYSRRQVCGRTSRGHTGERSHSISPSAVLALIFLARRIQPFLPVSNVKSNFVYYSELIVLLFLGLFIYFILFFVRKNPSSCDCTEIRTHASSSKGFEVTN